MRHWVCLRVVSCVACVFAGLLAPAFASNWQLNVDLIPYPTDGIASFQSSSVSVKVLSNVSAAVTESGTSGVFVITGNVLPSAATNTIELELRPDAGYVNRTVLLRFGAFENLRRTLTLTVLAKGQSYSRQFLLPVNDQIMLTGTTPKAQQSRDTALAVDSNAYRLFKEGSPRATYGTESELYLLYNLADVLLATCIHDGYATCQEASGLWTELEHRYEAPTPVERAAFRAEKIDQQKILGALANLQDHARKLQYATMKADYTQGGAGFARAYCELSSFIDDFKSGPSAKSSWQRDQITLASLYRDAGKAAFRFSKLLRDDQRNNDISSQALMSTVTQNLHCGDFNSYADLIPVAKAREYIYGLRLKLLKISVEDISMSCKVGSDRAQAQRALKYIRGFFSELSANPPDRGACWN